MTSFSVNPVEPYYIAIGCENSLLRVYDRRSMATGDPDKETDKQRGLLYQFKPKALDKRDCRVTSLKYRFVGMVLLNLVYICIGDKSKLSRLVTNRVSSVETAGIFSRYSKRTV